MVFKKGQIPWNKGLPKEKQPHYNKKHTEETKKKMGLKHKGKKISDWQKKCISKAQQGNKSWLGKKHTEETKLKMSLSKQGNNHPNWKGGKIKTRKGHIKIYSPNHPFKDKSGYVFEHRLIMEQHLGRYLTKEEVIHHINEITNDNRIENLMLLENKGKHKAFHLNKLRLLCKKMSET